MTWTHLVDPAEEDLRRAFSHPLHPQAITNMLRRRSFRDRIFSNLVEHDGYLAGEIAVPAHDDIPFEMEVIGLRALATHDELVTVFQTPVGMPGSFSLSDFQPLRDQADTNDWGPGRIISRILETVADDIHRQLDDAQVSVDELEQELRVAESRVDDPVEFRNRISQLRRLFNDVEETIPSIIDMCQDIASDSLDLITEHEQPLFDRDVEIYLLETLAQLEHAKSRCRYGLQEMSVIQDNYVVMLDREQAAAGNRVAAYANVLLWPTLIVGFWGMNINSSYFSEMEYLNGPLIAGLLLLLMFILWHRQKKWE